MSGPCSIALVKEMKPIPMGHRLMNHDGHCKFLHGHNYAWRLAFNRHSYLVDGNGMVIDLGRLKAIQTMMERVYDHSLVLYADDPLTKVSEIAAHSRLVTVPFHPTVENIAWHWGKSIQEYLKRDHPYVYLSWIEVWETHNGMARVDFSKDIYDAPKA